MCVLGDGIILGFLAFCGICDWKHRCIPVYILSLFSVTAFFLVCFCGKENLGSVAAGAMLGLLFFGFSKITKEEIGYGDSWIITIMGVYLGIEKVLWVLFLASMSAGLLSLVYLWKNNWKRGGALPFVPFIVPAYLVVMLL